MPKNTTLIFLLLFSLIQLTGCGGGSGGGDEGGNPEPLPTDSALVTSRSPDNNEINVSVNADITITADQSIISDGLSLVLFDISQNENCEYIRGDGPNCPWFDAGLVFTNPAIQGNTVVFTHAFELKPDTNYIVFLSTNNDSFLLQWSIRTNSAGVFLDGPVINIGYRTDTLEGVTNKQGTYEYVAGESVTFFIGDLVFPTVPAKGTITPLDLAGTTDINDPEVVNIIRLLQTLDQDGNPANGLTITAAAKTVVTQVDFTLPLLDFENSTAVTSLITNAGQNNTVSNLVASSGALSHFQGQLTALENLKFNSATLPGIYNVEARAVAGTHQFTFIDDGTVNIVWADGNEEIANWSVNNIGQLILSGPTFSDILTLTSGNQSSGGLEIMVDDEDGIFNTPGTIKLAIFDGSYNATLTSTTPLNQFDIPCEGASGVMNIDNSIVTGSITGTNGGTANISGDVQSDGTILGSLANSNYFTNFTGSISGTSGSGSWSEQFGCAGTWVMTKNLP